MKNINRSMLAINQYLSSETCLKCKGCCRFSSLDWLPQLLKHEKQATGIKTINAKLEKHLFICQFLNQTNHHCKIYEKRPFECRLYPFLLLRDKDNLKLAAHLACPYVINKIEDKNFKNYCAYISAFLKQPKNIKILKDELENFHTYNLDELYIIEENLHSDY